MGKTYAHLSEEIEAHYRNDSCTCVVDPPGRGAPDILGKRRNGRTLVGEIKSTSEARSSASSWWNYWTKPERDLRVCYGMEPPSSPSALRGWCAVIDGQLREYCEKASVTSGDLVVENGARHRADVETALFFLKSERRTAGSSHSIDGSLDYWTIQYASLP